MNEQQTKSKLIKRWIVAVDSDSFNCTPQQLRRDQLNEAKKQNYAIYHTLDLCQKACDHENSL